MSAAALFCAYWLLAMAPELPDEHAIHAGCEHAYTAAEFDGCARHFAALVREGRTRWEWADLMCGGPAFAAKE